MAKTKKIPGVRFKFQRQIRIIKNKAIAPTLFDEKQEEPEYLPRRFAYEGTVLGILAKISYDDYSRYWIGTQEKIHLNEVYNEVINRLLGNGHHEDRSLVEILDRG